MKRPEASLPALIFLAPVFFLEDSHHYGPQECKDETNHQNGKLRYHAISYAQHVRNLT